MKTSFSDQWQNMMFFRGAIISYGERAIYPWLAIINIFWLFLVRVNKNLPRDLWCTHWVSRHSMHTPQNNRNAYMHEDETIKVSIECRKYLIRCTPFFGVSQWSLHECDIYCDTDHSNWSHTFRTDLMCNFCLYQSTKEVCFLWCQVLSIQASSYWSKTVWLSDVIHS